jgi:GNAT superfamily N-acetyltransferase
MGAPSDPAIRVCGRADRALQAALYDRCFGKDDGDVVLPWRYDQGPHGESVSLVVELDGVAISGYACSPRHVVPHGDEARAATVGQTGDVMTDLEHRGRGIFSSLDAAAMEAARARGWPVAYGLPNRQSAHLFVGKLGWQAVGSIRPWTFVLTTDAHARAERLKAGRLAASALAWTYWRGTMRRGMLRKMFFEKCNVVPLPRFEPEVDALWAEVAVAWPWMVRRDHTWLNWRFSDAPSKRFKAQGVYEPGGKMVGYCVVQLPAAGDPVGHVVDILARDDVAFAAAMEAALGHLHKAAASVARAHAVAGSWWERKLRWAGFRSPKADDQKTIIAYVLDAQHPLAQTALAPESWYFTDADRDDELVR